MKLKVTILFLLLFTVYSALADLLSDGKAKELAKDLAVLMLKKNKESIFKDEKKEYLGAEFNALFKGRSFIKLMTENEKYREFQYHDGMCIDATKFSPEEAYNSDALYFTDIVRIQNHYNGAKHRHFRLVTIPNEAKVHIENGVFWATKLCLQYQSTTNKLNNLKSDMRLLLGEKIKESARKNEYSKIDFYRANLKYVDLDGVNFIGANLKNAYFEGVNFSNAHFQNARLEGSNFKGGYLEGANFRGAYLDDAHFEYAHLDATNFEGAHLERAHLENTNLRYAYLNNSDLRYSNLQYANLQGAHLQIADLRHVNFKRANLLHTGFEGADVEGAYFQWVFVLNLNGAKNIDKCIREIPIDE